MWERLRSIWTIPDLRNKILFTLGILLAFRILANISVPLDKAGYQALQQLFNPANSGLGGQVFGLLDVFSGGSLDKFSIVGLAVYPYITATIVMQLLQPIIPALQNLAAQGEAGRLRFSQITRLVTVPLAFLQAIGQCALYQSPSFHVLTNFSLFDPRSALESWTILFTLTAGVMILVWMGELITEKGIGNGISLIIFANIVSRLPNQIIQGYSSAFSSGGTGVVGVGVFIIIALATIVGIVYIYQGQRRIPVQYPTKRSVGRGMLVGSSQTTYIPMQVNSAGMIPLIFASSLLLFPTVISQYLQASSIGWLKTTAIWLGVILNASSWWYWLIEALLVIAFTYFYAYVMWQQQNIPENLQKQGAFIPGYRPGEPTNRYLTTILNRITLGGAIFLGIVTFAQWPAGAGGGGSQVYSAASILIAVGVVLDTVRQLEAQMVMRNYSGFLS